MIEVLVERVRPWMRDRLGVPLSEMRSGPPPVVAADPAKAGLPLRAVRLGNETVLAAREEWVEPLREVVRTLDPDVLFSTFGAFELARVTLKDGVSIWGPDWYLFGDERTVIATADNRPVYLEPSALQDFDYSVFWHCDPDALAGFAVLDGDDLLALATVIDDGDPFWEIGMEVAPGAQGRGLGKAVVAAAARWILDNGKLVVASVAPFNTPSARTLRSVGLHYVFSSMRGSEGDTRVFPQQLGLPLSGAPVYNHYPDWAINKAILPKRRE